MATDYLSINSKTNSALNRSNSLKEQQTVFCQIHCQQETNNDGHFEPFAAKSACHSQKRGQATSVKASCALRVGFQKKHKAVGHKSEG